MLKDHAARRYQVFGGQEIAALDQPACGEVGSFVGREHEGNPTSPRPEPSSRGAHENEPAREEEWTGSTEAPLPELTADVLKLFGTMPSEMTPTGYEMTDELITLGRMLFYEPRLSISGQMSCNTCHGLNSYGMDGLRRHARSALITASHIAPAASPPPATSQAAVELIERPRHTGPSPRPRRPGPTSSSGCLPPTIES
jgi:hypothetical protein